MRYHPRRNLIRVADDSHEVAPTGLFSSRDEALEYLQYRETGGVLQTACGSFLRLTRMTIPASPDSLQAGRGEGDVVRGGYASSHNQAIAETTPSSLNGESCCLVD